MNKNNLKRYYLDRESLELKERKKPSFFEKFNDKMYSMSFYILVLFVFAIAYSMTDPTKLVLKHENLYLRSQYANVSERIEELESYIKLFRDKDELLYRLILGIDPITRTYDETISIKYKDNSKFSYVSEMSHRMDSITNTVLDQMVSYENLFNAIRGKELMLANLPSIQPINNNDLKHMVSGWGIRLDPIEKIRKFHYGMDFVCEIGTPVICTGNGTVLKIGNDGGYGKYLIIDHGFGYETLYAHLSEILVEEKYIVTRKDTIAKSGNTGRSSGPHLHYEIIQNGKKINPINYFYRDLDFLKFTQLNDLCKNNEASYD